MGTPVGFFGGWVDYALLESVGAGAGAGSGPDWLSLHIAAGARWRVLLGALNAGYLAVEYSTGGYRQFESHALAPSGLSETWTNTDITAERAHRLQLSLGWEHRWRVALGTACGLRACEGHVRPCAELSASRWCPLA